MKEQKQKIFDFYRRYKRMPSYSEIMKIVGYKSKNAVYKLVVKLVDEGVIGKDKQGKLFPIRLGGELLLLGSIQAGFPAPAEEDMLDTIGLEELLVRDIEKTYLARVKGDSMIDAGIHEGDLVVVEKSDVANVGSIVFAELDGEWTMKYLRQRGDIYYLEAANEDYPDMYPENDLSIGGIVRGVIRTYK